MAVPEAIKKERIPKLYIHLALMWFTSVGY